MNKPTTSSDPDEEEDGATGKTIPYEESPLHLGFDVARMSMSDKIFLQSILQRWTGQQDLCLLHSAIKMRYLVLYHAHFLTDESVLQLQECLEQYPSFTILLTTELPICHRLRDYCLEIPVTGEDHLLAKYNKEQRFRATNVWMDFFQKTAEEWSQWKKSDAEMVIDLRQWIYLCLQRNLRWTDMIMYWIHTAYSLPWLSRSQRGGLLTLLWKAESGSGWKLVTSYRIPMMWEHVQLQIARYLYKSRGTACPPVPPPSKPSILPVLSPSTVLPVFSVPSIPPASSTPTLPSTSGGHKRPQGPQPLRDCFAPTPPLPSTSCLPPASFAPPVLPASPLPSAPPASLASQYPTGSSKASSKASSTPSYTLTLDI